MMRVHMTFVTTVGLPLDSVTPPQSKIRLMMSPVCSGSLSLVGMMRVHMTFVTTVGLPLASVTLHQSIDEQGDMALSAGSTST
jgi:hypothetical protein